MSRSTRKARCSARPSIGCVRFFPKRSRASPTQPASCSGRAYAYDLVRPGIALYGGKPQHHGDHDFAPVVHLKGRILQVRDVPAGETVGYGATQDFDSGVARRHRLGGLCRRLLPLALSQGRRCWLRRLCRRPCCADFGPRVDGPDHPRCDGRAGAGFPPRRVGRADRTQCAHADARPSCGAPSTTRC